jgi:tRNA-Thr(GGU) m(6)t(6)A37 methyltransferase TsaA
MEPIIFTPVGVIRSPFTEQKGTPIQPKAAASIGGTVEVFPEYSAGLKDLDGFDRIILIYHLNCIKEGKLAVTPYLDNQPRGIFATRSPCRPNPIGISCVKLIAVRENILEIEELDILDGTPLLDIKPYVPGFDHFEVKRAGWFDNVVFDNNKADDRFA